MSRQTPQVEQLREFPCLVHLTDEECGQLAEHGELLNFAPGEVIINEGKQSQNLWMIVRGECEVYRKNKQHEIVFTKLGPKDSFGEMSFFHPAPHSASVRAETAVSVFRLSRAAFDRMIEGGEMAVYKVAFNSVEGLARRIREMDVWIERLLEQNQTQPDRVHEWSQFRSNLLGEWNL